MPDLRPYETTGTLQAQTDRFAAAALTGIIAATENKLKFERAAEDAYEYARAMMRERATRDENGAPQEAQ